MNIATIIIYIVFLGRMFYFMLIKPQKKEKKTSGRNVCQHGNR